MDIKAHFFRCTARTLFWLFFFLLSTPLLSLIHGCASLDAHVFSQFSGLIRSVWVDTLLISFSSASLACLVGGSIAFVLVRYRFSCHSLCVACVVVALAIPIHAQTSTWITLAGRGGILTPSLQSLFPSFSLYNRWGVIGITAIAHAPLATLICSAAFAMIDPIWEEQTAFYLSPAKRICSVVLPQARWGIVTAFITVFLFSLGEITVTDVLGIDTLARKMYLFLSLYYEPTAALLLAFPFFLFTTVGSASLYFLLRNRKMGNFRPPSPCPHAMVLSWMVLPLSLYLLPVPMMAYRSQGAGHLISVYRSIAPELWSSIRICLMGATLLTSLSFLCSWYISRFARFYWAIVFMLVWLALVPGALTGIGIIRIVEKCLDLPGIGALFFYLRDTSSLLIAGFVVRYFPYATLIFLVGMRFVPPQLEETFILQGNHPLKGAIFILIPLLRTTFSLVFLASFIFCLGDLDLSVLIVPPGTTTLTVRIFTLMHYGIRADVACSSLYSMICVGAIFIACFMFHALIRGRPRRNENQDRFVSRRPGKGS